MQTSVLVISLVLIGVVGLVFARVALLSVLPAETDARYGAIERKRHLLIWSLFALGFVVAYVSLRPWPHDASASEGTVRVDIIGNQWSWEVSTKEVPVDTPIVFNVSSNDVNHGMGVYSPGGALLFQTQGMPGVVNRVKYTFSETGTYKILCMEYCGLVHHDMKDEIKVVAK